MPVSKLNKWKLIIPLILFVATAAISASGCSSDPKTNNFDSAKVQDQNNKISNDVKFIQDKALDQVVVLSATGKRAIIQMADGLSSWSSGIKSYGINPSSLENSLKKIPDKYYLITLIGYKVIRVEFYTKDNTFKIYLNPEAGLYNVGIPITEYTKRGEKATLKYFSGDAEIKIN
jgi:hypothetical protein